MNEYSGFSKTISTDVIQLAQQGDVKAMEAIYNTYVNACYSLAMRILREQSAAQDVVQNAFIKAMKSINSYQFKGPFAGWLRTITVNEALTAVKRQNNQHEILDIEQVESQHAEGAELDADHYFDIGWWETCSDLSHFTNHLSVNARTVLFLHELEGYSHREIAELLDKTESYSKQTLARSLKKLKELSDKEGNNDV